MMITADVKLDDGSGSRILFFPSRRWHRLNTKHSWLLTTSQILRGLTWISSYKRPGRSVVAPLQHEIETEMQRTDLSKRHCSVRIPSKFVRSQCRPIEKKESIASWTKRLHCVSKKRTTASDTFMWSARCRLKWVSHFELGNTSFFLKIRHALIFFFANSCILRHLDEINSIFRMKRFFNLQRMRDVSSRALNEFDKVQSSSIFNAKSRFSEIKNKRIVFITELLGSNFTIFLGNQCMGISTLKSRLIFYWKDIWYRSFIFEVMMILNW